MKLTDGRGVDLAIDTSGTEICVRQGMEALVKGGTQVLVGYSASGDMKLPTSLICDKEITIKSVFRYEDLADFHYRFNDICFFIYTSVHYILNII